MHSIKNKITVLILAIKYWLQGDNWQFAKEYAEAIVGAFRYVSKGNG